MPCLEFILLPVGTQPIFKRINYNQSPSQTQLPEDNMRKIQFPLETLFLLRYFQHTLIQTHYNKLSQMISRPSTLSENGIYRAVNEGNFMNVILQVIEFNGTRKQVGTQLLYESEISDGYTKLRCYFSNDLLPKIDENFEVFNNQIIVIKRYGATIKSMLIYDYEVVVEHYREMIGRPIHYKEFLNEGKPVSNNFIKQDKIVTKPLASSTKKPIVPTEVPTIKKWLPPVDPSELDLIADLYPDMHNWRIYCRVIKVNYSEFEAKSGNFTKLLAMELMDRKGSTIKATIFGDHAKHMSTIIQSGDTFTFSKGMVKRDTYRKGSLTSSEYAIILSQSSRIFATTDDHSIKNPKVNFLTVNDLRQLEANTEVDVVGIVKQINYAYEIPSKDSKKSLRKRTVIICDPIHKVEIDAVFWNDLTDIDEGLLHRSVLLSEFRMHHYNGSLSINSSFRSKITELKNHPLNEYEQRVDQLEYETISYRGSSEHRTIKTIKALEEAQQSLAEEGCIWSELRVYLNRIKDGKTKKTYESCPFCKKTVLPDDHFCVNCTKPFSKSQTRYILSIQLSDFTGSIWSTAYDDLAERIFKVTGGNYPASAVKHFEDKQFDDLTKVCLFQEFKIKVITKHEITDKVRRAKHNIAKVMPLNYIAETKDNLSYIRNMI